MMRLFVTVIILVAIAVGVLALFLHRDQLVTLIIFRDFFDVTLPILGFGALVKFLCTNWSGCGCGPKCNCGSSCACKK